ncbi:MAG: hypothetical protein HYZ27_12615 [Deltaproteobacteria bacterium]|nr:hypothetical protein [Deltaproteobacteria bacterium]
MAVKKMMLEHQGKDICELVVQVTANTESFETDADGKIIPVLRELGPVEFNIPPKFAPLFGGIFNRFVLKDAKGRWKLSVASRPSPPRYQVTGQITPDREAGEAPKA